MQTFNTSAIQFPHVLRTSSGVRPSRLIITGLMLVNCLACGRQSPVVAQPPLQPTPLARSIGEDWPCFLGPRADGSSTEQGIDPARWRPIPPVLWSLPLGTSYGAPTIADGRL